MKKSVWMVLLLIGTALFFPLDFLRSEPGVQEQTVEKPQWELEFQRIKELYQLTDLYNDEIWPGFDTRKIPIAVNYKGRQQILINHPIPPGEFREFKDLDPDGQKVMIRDGSTTLAVGGAGRLGKIKTSVLSVPEKETSTEKYLLMGLHECFHVFQQQIREEERIPFKLLPIYDIPYAALIALENRILYTALQEKDAKTRKHLVKMFVAVRSRRQQDLPDELRKQEDRENFGEGTAYYAEVRLVQLLQRTAGRRPPLVKIDPGYHGFSEAGKLYREYLESILPPDDKPVTLGHERYQNGMAQALLLDSLHPGWKKEMSAKGMTQFTLLKRQFPMEEKEIAALVSAAREKFNFEKILEHQGLVIRETLSSAYRFLDAPGRRYRIYQPEIPTTFKWKPRLPVFELPLKYLTKAQLELLPQGIKINEDYMDVLILVKGVERVEYGGLVFESGEVPILWWDSLSYFEWIDPFPAADQGDMKITSDKQENDIYTNLILTTSGFTLRVDRARVIWSDQIVEIHPLQP